MLRRSHRRRSTAAMAAQPFIDYYDHTLDRAFLSAWAYPYVREVARFYASYVRFDDATQFYEVPIACAQELCGQRNGVCRLHTLTMPRPRVTSSCIPSPGAT